MKTKELKKFIEDYEIDWDMSDDGIILFLNFHQLEQFTKIVGEDYFDFKFDIELHYLHVSILLTAILDYFGISEDEIV